MKDQTRIEWQMVPSATVGGKQHFFTTVIGETRYWVVWDRVKEAWEVQDNHGAVWGSFKSSANAMDVIERM